MSAGEPVWIPGSAIVTDTSIASWAQELQSDDLRRVDFQVPSGFERYCRIFHRIQCSGEEMMWSHFAGQAGVALGAETRWAEIQHKLGSPKGVGPIIGSLDDDSFQSVLQVFRDWHGSNIELVAGFWDGIYNFGAFGLPTVRLGLRDQVLFKSDLSSLIAATEAGVAQFPGVLWPLDRTWYLSTDIDYNTTILGGSLDLIESLLSTDAIEAFQIGPDLDLTVR